MKKSNKAFSLFEVSVIIMIAGIIISGYIAFIVPATESDSVKYKITQERLFAISQALEKYVLTFDRLLCPALATQEYGTINAVTNIGFNAENISSNNCVSSVGSVPSAPLGLMPEMMLDGWGRKITYAVFPTLCGTSGCTASTYNQNPASLYTIATASSSSVITNTAAYVLISHGPAGRGAYTKSGNQISGSASDELENIDGDNNFVSTNLSQSFQHILFYRNKADLTGLASNPTATIITLADCLSNSTEFATITRNIAHVSGGNMRSSITSTQNSVTRNNDNGSSTTYTTNFGDEAVLDIMWNLQEACYLLYPSLMPAIKSCPGGGVYQGNGLNDSGCVCPSGDWNNNC